MIGEINTRTAERDRARSRDTALVRDPSAVEHADLLPAVAADRPIRDLKSLRRHHGQVYGQNGEDGMIAEIFRRIGGPQNRLFIEIGIENGLQNNTRFCYNRAGAVCGSRARRSWHEQRATRLRSTFHVDSCRSSTA